MLDIVVQDVHFVAHDTVVPEPVAVCLQDPGETLLDNVGLDVEILELGIALTLADDQGVLLYQIRFLLLFHLAGFELLLELLDQPTGCVQVRTGSRNFTRFFHVRAAVCPESIGKEIRLKICD